jgi:hypothetical protein
MPMLTATTNSTNVDVPMPMPLMPRPTANDNDMALLPHHHYSLTNMQMMRLDNATQGRPKRCQLHCLGAKYVFIFIYLLFSTNQLFLFIFRFLALDIANTHSPQLPCPTPLLRAPVSRVVL